MLTNRIIDFEGENVRTSQAGIIPLSDLTGEDFKKGDILTLNNEGKWCNTGILEECSN